MTRTEFQQFSATWEVEAEKSLLLIRALPVDQYDFRPDAGGRSLGELTWHLAETEAVISTTVAAGRFEPGAKIPGLERPRKVEELAPGVRRIHREAVARLQDLSDAQLNASLPFLGGRSTPVSELLWVWLLMGNIHHRGQLSLMCRLAGGIAPGMYGPNREDMAAFHAQQTKSVGA